MAKKSNRKDHITKKDSRSYGSISNKLKANVLYLSYFISLFLVILAIIFPYEKYTSSDFLQG